MPRRAALEEAHFPPNDASVEVLNAFRTPAQRRLIFEEFFLFQIGHAWRRHASGTRAEAVRADRGRSHPRLGGEGAAVQADARAAAGGEGDRRRHAAGREPMHRLLQGDVGAGKTIVALLAAIVAMENGLQVAFMAPTEILAGAALRQHRAAAGARRGSASIC